MRRRAPTCTPRRRPKTPRSGVWWQTWWGACSEARRSGSCSTPWKPHPPRRRSWTRSAGCSTRRTEDVHDHDASAGLGPRGLAVAGRPRRGGARRPPRPPSGAGGPHPPPSRRPGPGRRGGGRLRAVARAPAVIGWLRPVILLPASALTGLTPLQLDALLAHELAHVRRYDYLVNLIQSVIETLLFYHPAVWWVSARVRDEREHCCDDLAVAVCGDAHFYASALLGMERLRVTIPTLALTAAGGSLMGRVRRLVAPPPLEIFPRWTAGVLAASLVLAASGSHLLRTGATPPGHPADGASTAPASVLRYPDPAQPLAQRWDWALGRGVRMGDGFWIGYRVRQAAATGHRRSEEHHRERRDEWRGAPAMDPRGTGPSPPNGWGIIQPRRPSAGSPTPRGTTPPARARAGGQGAADQSIPSGDRLAARAGPDPRRSRSTARGGRGPGPQERPARAADDDRDRALRSRRGRPTRGGRGPGRDERCGPARGHRHRPHPSGP